MSSPPIVQLDKGQISKNHALPIDAATADGVVFNDLNANGQQDAGEDDVVGLRVFADLNGDGKYEPTEPSVLTDATGQWELPCLPNGTYLLRCDA